MAMTIFVPRHLDENPVYYCTLCEARFYADEKHQYERHVIGHPLEDVRAQSPSYQAPGIFGDKGGDEDWGAWVKAHAESDPGGWAKWGRTGDGKSSSGIGDGS